MRVRFFSVCVCVTLLEKSVSAECTHWFIVVTFSRYSFFPFFSIVIVATAYFHLKTCKVLLHFFIVLIFRAKLFFMLNQNLVGTKQQNHFRITTKTIATSIKLFKFMCGIEQHVYIYVSYVWCIVRLKNLHNQCVSPGVQSPIFAHHLSMWDALLSSEWLLLFRVLFVRAFGNPCIVPKKKKKEKRIV